MNNIEKELQRLEKRPKAKIHVDSLRATLGRVPNWKTPDHGGCHVISRGDDRGKMNTILPLEWTVETRQKSDR